MDETASRCRHNSIHRLGATHSDGNADGMGAMSHHTPLVAASQSRGNAMLPTVIRSRA